jgi:hypothetical protein
MTIRNTNDLIRAAAEALIRRDVIAIAKLARMSDGWIESNGEAVARRLLLKAVHEAACLLQGQKSYLEDGDEF